MLSRADGPAAPSNLQGAVRLALHNAGNKDTGYGLKVRQFIKAISKTRDAIDCKKYTKQASAIPEVMKSLQIAFLLQGQHRPTRLRFLEQGAGVCPLLGPASL